MYSRRALSYKRLGSYDLAIADFRTSIRVYNSNLDYMFSEIGDSYNI